MKAAWLKLGVLAIGLTVAANVWAVDDGYFTIQAIKVEALGEEIIMNPAAAGIAIGTQACEDSDPSISQASPPKAVKPPVEVLPGKAKKPKDPTPAPAPVVVDPLDEINIIVDKILNLGKKLWQVVEAGKPVVNFRSDVASALPAGSRCWLDLQGWNAPKSYTYGVTFENAFGVDVINFKYRVIYLYGGTVNGVGKYIGYTTMQPVALDVAWGYKFNAAASVPTVFNQGTRANPVAAMQLNMNWSIETVLKRTEQTQAYFLNGNGKFELLP